MPNSPDDISVVKEAEVDTFSGKDRQERECRPALVFLRGELLAPPIPPDRKEVTLGRALEADVRGSDSRGSRLHARLPTQPGEADAQPRLPLGIWWGVKAWKRAAELSRRACAAATWARVSAAKSSRHFCWMPITRRE